MKIFFTILSYLILHPSKLQQLSALTHNCKPDCSNLPKRECNKFEIELRASLATCTSPIAPLTEASTPCDVNSIEEPKLNKNTLKCTKKLSGTLKITNQGETTISNQYIIIDHILDGKSGKRVSLLNPYVIVLRQRPIMQLYGLKFMAILNGEITEKVINRRNPNFRGCDGFSKNPPCGNIAHKGKFIPYSQGFCCSCNSNKNFKRQLRTAQLLKEEIETPKMNFQEFIYHNIKPDNNIVFSNRRNEHFGNKFKRNTDYFDFNDYLNRHRSKLMPREAKTYRNTLEAPDYAEIFYDYNIEQSNLPKQEMESLPKNIQIRGGQDCDQNETSDESAHCAQFSNVWYSVYQISNPILEHTIFMKIFEKRERDNGGTDWYDLSSGSTVEIGTLQTRYIDKQRSLQVKYYNSGPDAVPIRFSLDPNSKRILVPRPSKNGGNNDAFCKTTGDPAEYLVVDEKDINSSGDQCDTAGVGYKAFFNQPDRCSVLPGSCLKNQPSQLWRRDKRACKRHNRGKYFLKNFARVPDQKAIRTTAQGNTKYLALYFDAKLKSTLDIDIKIDDNMIFQNIARAQITEIYIDGTSAAVTLLIIKIFNSGLISSTFHPRLSDCPLELPVEWSNLEGDPVIIPPQHHAIFTMRLFGTLSVSKFFCSVEALNRRSEIIAVRRIQIVQGDRCICVWHCLCACLKKTGLGCNLMAMEHYKAAGFIGSMPLTTTMVQTNNLDNVLFGFCYLTLLLTCILVILGLTKAVIGLYFTPIGIWGLDMLIGFRPINQYYEKSLKHRCVAYDCEDWPVHPDTYQRTVRITPMHVEFCLNVTFFFTYPIMLLLILSIKLCCPFYAYHSNEDKGATFKVINTIIYSDCPPSKVDSDSEDSDQFEFEDISCSRK